MFHARQRHPDPLPQRSSSATGPWSVLTTIPSDKLTTGPGVGSTLTYVDRTRDTYYYNVYAVNIVGDTWDYSNPGFNEIPPGGGWPTLVLDSRIGPTAPQDAVAAPSNLTGSAAVKNRKAATVTLNWTDNAGNETGFLVQRAFDPGFTSGLSNATIAGADITTFSETVSRGVTYYYRVHAFNDTTQSGWSNTATVVTPK